MKAKKAAPQASFGAEASRILNLKVAHRVSSIGGYGPGGEVIYEKHPDGCPSVLVANRGSAKATFMSNGSIAFELKLPEGMDIHVLSGSFDATEKREINVPSGNVWISVAGPRTPAIASLINPRVNVNCEPSALKVVKLGDPGRAMWYCATFKPAPGIAFQTAVKLSLVDAEGGPALLREVFVSNLSRRPLKAALWTFFNLHGTQRFVYNKVIWYDSGLPLDLKETVVAATVPYSSIVQIKRVSSVPGAGLKAVDATCDYTAFVGDSAAPSDMPQAVRLGKLQKGAGRKLNRFSIATIAANQFALNLAGGASTQLQQCLLYVTDAALIDAFRAKASCESADYPRVSRCFVAAAKEIVARTADARATSVRAAAALASMPPPAFEFILPGQPVISEYAKSLWTGVQELYENCRAHGAKMAQGIELGTRDRGQDMWPKMKEDAARVRADLVHALSFMYVTRDDGAPWSTSLTRIEKLHGMFPRQYPSRWDDRSVEVKNDNRPYADSPLWLIDSANMYVRETGDCGMLAETVKTARLTSPEQPESSGIVGCEKTFTVAEVLLQVLECFRRHVDDSPYGMAQIMYGDWCDPIDMFGTSVVGDATTRGNGRGVQTRLSAHLFGSLVATIELFESQKVRKQIAVEDLDGRLSQLKQLASRLRTNIVRFAWENGPDAGFIGVIHELKKDGSRPNYDTGEIGYTLGSMRGLDFDGAPRRELVSQAYCLNMLLEEREYLAPVADRDGIIQALLQTTDQLMYSDRLGLRLFHPPIANNEISRRLVGRMGIVPAGCAENGEYHHGQAMMHRFRLPLPGQADMAWKQFRRIVSATRDESLGGPFEMPSTSYASDSADPHFGKGMYFGLSGSTDWIIEVFQEVAGVKLALHDDAQPAVKVSPHLPAELGRALTLRRPIHCWTGSGYRRIPLQVQIAAEGKGKRVESVRCLINGQPATSPEVRSLDGVDKLDIAITYILGK